MQKNQKKYIEKEFNSIIQQHNLILFVQYNNLVIKDWNQLKLKLNQNNFGMKVVKNRVIQKSLEKNQLTQLTSMACGPTAMIFGNEMENIGSCLSSLEKNNTCTLLGGKIGNKLYSCSHIKRITKLDKHSFPVEIVNTLYSPFNQLNDSITSSSTYLARLLSAAKKE